MTLYSVKDFGMDHSHPFYQNHICGFTLCTGEEKVGSVDDLLVDCDGKFRYLVIKTWPWISGKKVLLPIGLSRIDYKARRLYVDGLSRTQVKSLPEYNPNISVDREHEKQVRGVCRQQYDQMVKYANALRLGTAETEAILRRFNRSNPQHPTYRALAELGKAVKTIFLCQYLQLGCNSAARLTKG